MVTYMLILKNMVTCSPYFSLDFSCENERQDFCSTLM